jgi:tRNA (mo5U34)-methyltransferase
MSIPDYSPLYQELRGSSVDGWIPDLQRLVKANIEDSNDGHLPTWMSALRSLPHFECQSHDLENAVRFDGDVDTSDLENLLKTFHPWRKGPLDLATIRIDSEWRSDWKWDRLKKEITSLKDRTVLDIGSGNGYYLWRMLGVGARLAIGIDPFLLFVMQFWATKHFAPKNLNAWVLPLGWEDLPEQLPYFDTVFSMGVLYHRRNPEPFLKQLQNYVRPGGELVLETLVIDGSDGKVLVPDGRYAQMRNVWYIPSVATLEMALRDAGWKDVRCIDVTTTNFEEQRSTDWMTFESLKEFLDPKDSSKTIEGYPAPIRAVIIAQKPK